VAWRQVEDDEISNTPFRILLKYLEFFVNTRNTFLYFIKINFQYKRISNVHISTSKYFYAISYKRKIRRKV